MTGAVPGGQPRQATNDVDVQARLGDVQAQEVIGASRREHGVGRCEGNQAHLGHAGGRTQHDLLRHAHLEEAVWMGVAEDVHVRVLGEISGQADDLGAFVRETR
jgi:hypothetical protein